MRKPHSGLICCNVLYRLLCHTTLLKLVSRMYMICLFRQIAFSLYLVDVKGLRINLIHIHYICMINDDNWRQMHSINSAI